MRFSLSALVFALLSHSCCASRPGLRHQLRQPARIHNRAAEIAEKVSQDLKAEESKEVKAQGGRPDQEVGSVFSDFYERQVWGSEGRGSGSGSSQAVTAVTKAIIRTVVANYSLHSMLDAPCGALEWQPALIEQLREDDPSFTYQGVDVVPSVIQANQDRFADFPFMSFEIKNLIHDPIPKGLDLILSRDALQHLSCKMTVNMLANLARSRAKFYLLGSYAGTGNTNIKVGEYFSINLREPPYSMQEGVLRAYSEYTQNYLPGEPTKMLLLLSGKYLSTVDFPAMKIRCHEQPEPT